MGGRRKENHMSGEGGQAPHRFPNEESQRKKRFHNPQREAIKLFDKGGQRQAGKKPGRFTSGRMI